MTQTILVVEDNAITRKMMRVALETAGYRVFEAPDGKTAVGEAAKNSPALILQDLLLPDMDGLDLLKELRKAATGDQIPIVACTGLMSKLDEARTVQGGFTDYLFKPVEPSRLLEMVERYLPVAPPAAAKTKNKIKVLLADDNPVELKLEKLMLESQGFEVTAVGDGVQALETARQWRPDAVLCDLIMPRMNGFDLCLALRKEPAFAGLPIVLTSATGPYIDEGDRELAAKVGADAFVGRTPDLKEAVRALRAALGRRTHPKPAPDSQELLDNYFHRLVSQIEQRSSRSGELMRRSAEEKAQLSVIMSITETLNRKLPLQAALDEALAKILDAAGISAGAIYLVESGGKLVLKSQIGGSKSRSDDLREFFGHADLLHRALQERRTFKMPSEEISGPVARDLQKKIKSQSLLIAPLAAADEAAGVLVAFSSRNELGDEWVDSVRSVTVQLAQAVLLARTLERVSESERRFRELAENIREIFYVTGGDGRSIEYISPAYRQITGRRPEDIYRNPAARLEQIHPDDRPRVEQALISDPQNFDQEYRIRKPDGAVRWLRDRSFPVRDETGRVVRTVGIADDITERKQAERQAEQSLGRIRALHEIDLAIASTLDLDTRLGVLLEKIEIFLPIAAASAVRLLNPETGGLVSLARRGLNEHERKSRPRKVYRSRARRVVRTRAPVFVRNIHSDARSRHGSGSRRRGLVSYLGVPLIAEDQVLGVLSLYTRQEHDFTPQEIEFLNTLAGQAALAIRNAQLYEDTVRANKVKAEFLSVMSHELRTPLSVIVGYTGLVRDGSLGDINPDQAEALKKVLARASEQLNMINDIMQTTQLESRSVAAERVRLDFRALMESLQKDYATQTGKPNVALQWSYPGGPIVMKTDPRKLRQVLQNLVNNALKFTDAGTVKVAARVVADAQNRRRARGRRPATDRTKRDRIEVTVADTGVGISKDKLAAIFEKFYQVDSSETRLFGGVGLGLFIVKNFTELLGGKINVASEPGVGSTFTVKIPLES